MSVRETLELDVRPALTSVGQLDKALAGTTSKLKTGLAEATRQLEPSGGATASVNGLAKAVDTAGDSAVKASSGFGALEQTASRTITQAKEGQGSFLGLSRVVNQAGQAALIAGGAISGALALGVKAASALEDAFIPIGTLLGTNSAQARNLSNALRDVIANSPESAQELGLSAYTILSAGISGTANVIKTLKASQQLAEAGLGGLAQATDLVTSAVNSFSTENLSATKAAQLFFGAIASGKTTTQGLAEGFGQVAPLASATGVRFRELLSATAALTATGQQASVAYTGIRGVLTSVLRPSADAGAAARQLEIDFSATALASKGLAGFLTEIGEKAGGNVEILSKLFGSVEGVNAVLALTGPQAKAFADNLAGIDAAGKNLTARAREVRDSFGNQLKTAFNQAQIALEAVFKPFLPIIGSVVRGAADIAKGFQSIPAPVQQGVVGIAAFSGGALLLTGTLLTLSTRFGAAKSALIEFGREGSIADRVTTTLGNNLGLLSRGAAGLGTFFAVGPQLAQLTGDFELAGAAAGALAGTLIAPGVGTAIGAVLGGIAGGLGILGNEAEEARKKVVGLVGELDKLGEGRAARTFFENTTVSVEEFRATLIALDNAVPATRAGIQKNLTEELARLQTGFKTLAETSPPNARKVLDGLRELQTAGGKPLLSPKVVTDLEADLARGTQAFQRQAANTKASREETDKLTASLGLSGEALLTSGAAADEASKAHDDYIASLAKGLPTVTSFFDEATSKIKDFSAATDPNVILQNFKDQLTNIRDFNIRVQELMNAGLTELARIAVEKGPIAGAEIAKAFREADPAVQRELENTAAGVREQTSGLANYIAGPFASQLFGAGQNAVQGLADGLFSLRGVVVQAGSAIAAGFLNEVQDVLDMRSPSRVMFKLGTQAAEGFALGLDAGTERFVGPSGKRLALRPVIPIARTTATSGAALPAAATGSGALIENLVVQAPIPTPVAVGVETARRLRAEMYLRNL